MIARTSQNAQKCKLVPKTPSLDPQTCSVLFEGRRAGDAKRLAFTILSSKTVPALLNAAAGGSRGAGFSGGWASARARAGKPPGCNGGISAGLTGTEELARIHGANACPEGARRHRPQAGSPAWTSSFRAGTAKDCRPAHPFLLRTHARTHALTRLPGRA